MARKLLHEEGQFNVIWWNIGGRELTDHGELVFKLEVSLGLDGDKVAPCGANTYTIKSLHCFG